MPTWLTIVLIVLAAIAVILVVLYFIGRKLQRRQGEQAEAIEAAKQVTSILVIDKKKLKMSESGLPKVAIESTPWYGKLTKIPVVKANVGTAYGKKVMNLVADKAVFDLLPVGKQVTVEISGLYITGIKKVQHGSVEQKKGKKKNK